MDEQGNRKRKSFSGTSKQWANKKITADKGEADFCCKDAEWEVDGK